MFATFKMKLPSITGTDFSEYYKEGLLVYAGHKKQVHDSLDSYLSPEGALNASDIENDWFPAIQADVFLSHSHKDEKQVIAFAGYLHSIGLTAFIDSCVWGYADDLLKMIDDQYCVKSKDQKGNKTYSYESRNYSTAHVHMILNGALMKMMDRTECLIFLDTPNSLKVEDINDGATNSCWIYSELLMSGMLAKREPIRKSYRVDESFSHSSLEVEYDVDISHLIHISISDIALAFGKVRRKGKPVLDQLYCEKKLLKGCK